MNRFRTACALAAVLSIACSGPSAVVAPPSDKPAVVSGDAAPEKAIPACPAFDVHEGPFAHVTDSERAAGTWIRRLSPSEADSPVLNEADIAAHNAAVGNRGEGVVSRIDLLTPIAGDIPSLVRERLETFIGRARRRETRRADHAPWSDADLRGMTTAAGTFTPHAPGDLRVALETVQLRCAPMDAAVFASDGDGTYDRNACSAIRPQEPVEILADWVGQMWLVRTTFTFGWITADAPLSPPVPPELKRRIANGPRLFLTADAAVTAENGEVGKLHRLDTVVTDVAPGRILVATETGVSRAAIPEGALSTLRPLTRRNLLETAFSFLDSPYGLGGMNGGRDCSGFMADLFNAFGLLLPRTSEWQSRAGSFRIDVSTTSDADEKLKYIDEAARSGIVLLFFPGHIMLYLGRSNNGIPMVLHSLGEYASPCEGGSETIRRVQRVVVTDLSLGKETSRHSLLERITDVVVFARQLTEPVRPAASPRRAARAVSRPEDCNENHHLRIFVSPRRPVAGEPVRVIAVGQSDEAPAELFVWDSQGRSRTVSTRRLEGPPGAWIAEFIPDEPRRWTAALADGERLFACRRFGVLGDHPHSRRMRPESPYWESRHKWDVDTENLFSVFIERLFEQAAGDTRTWNNLQELLRDPGRNILHNHLGGNEDDAIVLSPDCADLPFVLRAYFAWKTSLPFAVRSCSRGKEGRPPSCGEALKTNNDIYEPKDPRKIRPVDAFQKFASVDVAWTIHSAAARTHPAQSDTDLYPIALSRNQLTPGTIFADPFGHVMMLTAWIPQKPGVPGILMAVDGQPDNTIGHRRFWPGTFLFDPDTTNAGAGFKRFRPLVRKRIMDETTGEKVLATVALENRELRNSERFPPYSRAQYEITTEAFYDQMDSLINPMPRPAAAVVRSHVDALAESVQRRVASLELGRSHVLKNNSRIIDMPEGYDIFETEGPWEDFASPSRDMRLLIAIDDVLALIDRLRARPERFGISEDNLAATLKEMSALLEAELREHRFTYPGSTGTPHPMTLASLIERLSALEVGYNPNDCPEIRWGAPAGSPELAACGFRAPAEQQRRMEEYRSWFRTRTRPPREN